MSHDPNAGELSISWQIFGSNGHKTADYSKGVLERFTRRESNEPNLHKTFGCKCIADSRKIKLIESPHNTTLLEGFVRVTEDGNIKTCQAWRLEPVHAEKLVVNHYRCMSWEEFSKRAPRGEASSLDGSKYSAEFFKKVDHNEVFDDGILKYRDERKKIYQPPDKSRAAERLLNALIKNLSPTLLPTTPPNFYAGKMETFLTCRAVAEYLKPKLADDALAKFFEEASLKAILKSFNGLNFVDARLFLRELPKLLSLPYPVVKEIRTFSLQLIPQMMNIFRVNSMWKDFVELDYLQDILKLGG